VSARLPTIDFLGLLAGVQAHREKHEALAESVERSSKLLIDAAQTVAKSSTGSWFGWHADMYYGDFEEPPLEHMFSVEWGAYRGLPEGWQQKRKQEIEKKIEGLAGVTSDKVENEAGQLGKAMIEIQDRVLTELSPIHNVTGFEKEKGLLTQVESLKWDSAAFHGFITMKQRASPTVTRDSEAVMQGARIPPHVHYEALAYCNLGKAKNANNFWMTVTRLLKQLHAQADSAAPGSGEALQDVLNICRRFHIAAKQLESRREGRNTITIGDEYDVQDVLHSLLRVRFDDVRPEEVSPSVAGRSARMDFLLKGERIVVETKMTRPNRNDKEIGDELLQDIARYKKHPDCSVLVCLIYDPQRLLKNPRGLEADLESQSGGHLVVKVIVTPS
jgi:hypothetical protein